tara:strand:- start:1449 stop:1715 length:267 start_codon:yes stop_codon:yes gene_type:complete
LVLHNIWDAGSAKAVAEAGANVIATGSWAVAAAQGYGAERRLPVNVMRMGDALDIAALAACGVARISRRPGPCIAAMKALAQASRGKI